MNQFVAHKRRNYQRQHPNRRARVELPLWRWVDLTLNAPVRRWKIMTDKEKLWDARWNRSKWEKAYRTFCDCEWMFEPGVYRDGIGFVPCYRDKENVIRQKLVIPDPPNWLCLAFSRAAENAERKLTDINTLRKKTVHRKLK